MTTEAGKETRGFQAEVVQLLDLMIHSLYSNKEIFLRELISNASDAIDKLRFEALSDETLYENDGDLGIRVSYDREARTVSVDDNGIGMSRQEVIDNIGTIARSGTKEFLSGLSGDQRQDANLIGQFGVGFYSSFVVADRVTVQSRRAGAPPADAVRWDSDGRGDYTIEAIEKPARGTTVTLHLRDGEDDLLDGHRLREIVRKYSDHINLPVFMVAESDGEEAPSEEMVNRAAALWTRPKNDISAEEYSEFYQHIAHEFTDPLTYIHARIEGRYEYTLLLYIPTHAPFDLWNRESRHGIKLYVRRVFIMDDAEQLMPAYLRFVRGIIDSSDLPLNVSREILQHNRVIESIRGTAVKRVLGLLADLARDKPEEYSSFWTEFGNVLKEGIAEDSANHDEIAALLRFSSTLQQGPEQTVSFHDYIGRMKEGQEKIYFLTADSYAAAKGSPLLEVFRQKDIEVLLLGDVIDNWVVAHLFNAEGKELQSVARGALDLSHIAGGEEVSSPPIDEEFKALVERIKESLGEKVAGVRPTFRLTTSPACLVSSEQDLDANFARLLKAAGQSVPATRPILEVNPHHPLLLRLEEETETARFADWAEVLFETALLGDGGQLEDPGRFVHSLNSLLLSLSVAAPHEESESPGDVAEEE